MTGPPTTNQLLAKLLAQLGTLGINNTGTPTPVASHAGPTPYVGPSTVGPSSVLHNSILGGYTGTYACGIGGWQNTRRVIAVFLIVRRSGCDDQKFVWGEREGLRSEVDVDVGHQRRCINTQRGDWYLLSVFAACNAITAQDGKSHVDDEGNKGWEVDGMMGGGCGLGEEGWKVGDRGWEVEECVECAEAEYRGVANAVVETCWLRNLLRELHTPLSSATLVYCDNISAVYLSCNPVQHQRTKHIEIDIHFVRDLVLAGQVQVLHVPSRYQFADIFIKRFPSTLFEEFRSSLSVRCPPSPTAGEC
ncbi:ribonuclease H-like domain-containing protein [Tanacetum coccineum]